MVATRRNLFPGTARYQPLAQIGQGGMGAVFHVFDRERNDEVALKTLLRMSPRALQMFKHEWRALADMAHPNLINLYELSAVDGLWFFTMELVRGFNFLEHVWGTTTLTEPETLVSGDDASSGPASLLRTAGPRLLSTEALRDATIQLVRGLMALHAAGKLHLDVKPANVIVSYSGRVVLLDFGLVRDLAQAAGVTSGGGTLPYMSPERLAGATVTPACDYYGLGAMIYEAATGAPPYSPNDRRAAIDPRTSDLQRPGQVVSNLPEWIDDLAMALLRQDPAARPSGPQILQLLGDTSSGRRMISLPAVDLRAEDTFAGREPELRSLVQALAAVSIGAPARVRVIGSSGIGKSTLVAHFLRSLRLRNDALVLEGRCYDRETVPFKAIDSVVDRLADHLVAHPEWLEGASPIPDVGCLTGLFPVLRRVDAFAKAESGEIADAQARRRRAFEALKMLLAHLSSKLPVVIFIDDFQWGDVDSATALAELLSPPAPPRMLLVTSDRDEGTAAAFHAVIDRALGDMASETTPRIVALRPLDTSSALTAAQSLLRRFGLDENVAPAIAEEAGGSPYFLRELVQHAALLNDDGGQAIPASLSEVLSARITALPAGARALLEVVALAGGPLDHQVATESADHASSDRSALALLRASRLLSVRTRGDQIALDAYHDRIRLTARALLTPEALRRRHLRLADVLESRPGSDPESISQHLLAAGATGRAGRYLLAAAENADRALAFDRAATLYARCREILHEHPEPWAITARMADALANAGRGRESGAAFREAATQIGAARPGDPRIFTWNRRAFEQYLRAGALEEGEQIFAGMAADLAIGLPVTRGQKIRAVVGERVRLAVRGLRARVRDDAGAGSVADQMRLEVCWGAAVPLSLVDPLRSSYLYARHLRLALGLGDAEHLVRGLSSEATNLAWLGGRRRLSRAERLMAMTDPLVQASGSQYARSFVAVSRGLLAHMRTDFQGALPHYQECEDRVRLVRGSSFELGAVHTFWAIAASYLGKLRELEARLPALARGADERGSLIHATGLHLFETLLLLKEDRPAEALAHADRAIALWPTSGFHLQHHNHLVVAVQARLYAGDTEGAWKQVQQTWPALEESLFMTGRAMADEARFLRARAALAHAAAAPPTSDARASLLRIVEKDARAIAASGLLWSSALVDLLRGVAHRQRGDTEAARDRLVAAAGAFDGLGMRLHAAAARWVSQRPGAIPGDEVHAAFEREGVRAPDRMTASLIGAAP